MTPILIAALMLPPGVAQLGRRGPAALYLAAAIGCLLASLVGYLRLRSYAGSSETVSDGQIVYHDTYYVAVNVAVPLIPIVTYLCLGCLFARLTRRDPERMATRDALTFWALHGLLLALLIHRTMPGLAPLPTTLWRDPAWIGWIGLAAFVAASTLRRR